MPVLADQKHELFARYVASGMSDIQAYQKAYECDYDSAHANAWRLKANDGISSRINDILGKSTEKMVLSLQEKRSFLRQVVVTPAGDVDEKSPLCQEVKVDKYGNKTLEMPDKLRALELDAKLAGELDGPERGVSIRIHLENVRSEREATRLDDKVIDVESERIEDVGEAE